MGLLYEVRYCHAEKNTSLWQQRLGDPSCRGGFQAEMYRMRSPDHGAAEDGGEKYQESAEKITRSMTQGKLK